MFDRFLSARAIKKLRSRFDKFNHVKYTKTLSVRNWRARIRLLFFAPNAPNAHKASFNAPFFRAHARLSCGARAAHRALIVSASNARAPRIKRQCLRGRRGGECAALAWAMAAHELASCGLDRGPRIGQARGLCGARAQCRRSGDSSASATPARAATLAQKSQCID
ncbi:hypothetical protein KY495_12335 [Massilia sp. PAMC28688]|uniref:hypothetical protein n=1 Tax=Massilia sp. PAMC28688 TaxID=2861283 RepID=UPI001C62CB8D|nr:hypothetical protein [Massilia sp. PAMC28688]QYF91599.1 hypothetical protein KY495_12335 [Massilia sp. PAMC28688]